ncbi:MAG: GNAT family N-acetyltransferase [Bacteroidota bacterium]|nr:GNAT family N-acetyltransferase [Bacteroidota bacterium]
MEQLRLNFTPFPTLFTERLELRQLSNEDFNDYYLIRSDKEVMRALDKNPNSIEETKMLFNSILENANNNTAISWVINFKNNKKLIGYIGFHRIDIPHRRAEIGYALFFNQHRKGIMKEAMAAVIQYGFKNMNLHTIEANINKENIASRNLLLKNGFIKEAHIKENYYFNGIYLDSVIYSLLNPKHAKNVLGST